MDLEPGNDRVLGQRRGIERPAIRNHLLQFQKIFLAHLPPPEFAERLHPEKREPHFLLEEWFDRRRDFHRAGPDSFQERGDAREIREVEELEEPVNVAARLRLGGLGLDHPPVVVRIFFAQLRGDPIHLRAIG